MPPRAYVPPHLRGVPQDQLGDRLSQFSRDHSRPATTTLFGGRGRGTRSSTTNGVNGHARGGRGGVTKKKKGKAALVVIMDQSMATTIVDHHRGTYGHAVHEAFIYQSLNCYFQLLVITSSSSSPTLVPQMGRKE
jgi:hypothetical protein